MDGKRYLSHAAMDELRKEQTGGPRSIIAWAITCATGCSATTALMARICRSIR